MKNASEVLMKEHESILFGLEILEAINNAIKSAKKFDIEEVKELVEFFKLFADRCHHGKEEGLLFPALEKVGIRNEGGPIGQMLAEHTQGRKLIAQMSESIKGIIDKDTFMQAAGDYIELLRAHIDKENMVLFPFGDRMLPAEEQARLLKQFEKHEEEVIGKETHEKLFGYLDKYKAGYLKVTNY